MIILYFVLVIHRFLFLVLLIEAFGVLYEHLMYEHTGNVVFIFILDGSRPGSSQYLESLLNVLLVH